MKLTIHEIAVLKMLAGEREPEWGAWVAACLECLQGAGLATGGPRYTITDKGKEELVRIKREHAAAEVMGA